MLTPWNYDDGTIDVYQQQKNREAQNVAMGLNPDGTIDTYAMMKEQEARDAKILLGNIKIWNI